MSTFKLEKKSTNNYPFIMKDEELKRLSFRIFSSLEKIVKGYENFTIIKQDYNDKKSGLKSTLIKSKISCKSFQDQEKKQVQDYLEIELTGGYKYNYDSLDGSYNQLNVQLQSNVKEVSTKVIADLFTKFKSFEEIIQGKYEEIRKFILSECPANLDGNEEIN